MQVVWEESETREVLLNSRTGQPPGRSLARNALTGISTDIPARAAVIVILTLENADSVR